MDSKDGFKLTHYRKRLLLDGFRSSNYNRLLCGASLLLAPLKTTERGRQGDPKSQPPRRVSIPGFIKDEEIGLGDAILRMTSYFGFKPCGGCRRRAAVLNRRVVFIRRQG
jgi:hypothetical protein